MASEMVRVKASELKQINHAASQTKQGSLFLKKAATVWADPEGQVDTGRVLRTHSKWNYFAISKMSGHTFYNLGGQQWIDGKLVKK